MITVLTYLLLLLQAIVCFLLISIILVQRTKSQGMGMAFGAGMGETLFGSHVGNVLTKATVFLAITFLVNTTVLALLGTKSQSGSVVDSVTDSIPVAPAPVAPAPMAQPFPEMPAPAPMPAVDLPAGAAIPMPTDVAVPVTAAADVPPVDVTPVDVSVAPALDVTPVDIPVAPAADVTPAPAAVPPAAE
jgi:preprotein translocase subunit SecG